MDVYLSSLPDEFIPPRIGRLSDWSGKQRRYVRWRTHRRKSRVMGR